MTKIDETALGAAIATIRPWLPAGSNQGQYPAKAYAEMAIAAYLAALPKPEGIPVRVCVAVAESNRVKAYGETGMDDDRLRYVVGFCEEQFQTHFVNATVPAWQPPVEAEVEGECE